MQTIKNFLFLFTFHEIKKLILLTAMILIMGLLDMIGVASILPFVAVLTNPSLIETNSIINSIFNASIIFGIEDDKDFLFILGVLVFAMLVISLSFKALTVYAQHRFVQMREYTIGKRLFESYLRQPYSWYLNRNSADLGKNILSEIQAIIGNGLNPLIEIMAKGVIAIAMILLLILIDIKLALVVGLILGGAYSLIFYILRSFLNRIGEVRLNSNKSRFLILSEAFGAIKEIKIKNLEKIFINRFDAPSKNYAKTTAQSQIAKNLPRFFLEAIAFGGAMLLILYLMMKKGNFNEVLPVITLYIFAGYRLIPSLQQIYNSLTQLTFINPSLNSLVNDLKNLSEIKSYNDQDNVLFKKKITLNNIQYSYPNSSRVTLKNINLTVNAKNVVGLVGSTGSGKTTIVDIILGLLETQKGTLEVDGKIITKKNIHIWQRLIGYVPQNICLIDDTIASNIAFGIDKKSIDLKSLEKASRIANLHSFVENELEKKYQTIVGERGVRLSGGQIQRIGIARALYHSPQVLVLDEATSALDNQTEKAVMDAINNLSKNITIILIAHRLSTVKICDEIYMLNNGELKQQTYDELIKNNN
jgi:ABC-type multidrug transport system fused ATPase/permease subunit